MKRIVAGLLALALLGTARAEDTAPAPVTEPAPVPLAADPQRLGYAFDQPEILLRQRLFGLAHGLSLLAAACLDLPEHAKAIENSYAAWHAGQAPAIESIVQELARYYFGPRASEAQWPDLARALGLADNIGPALGEVTLHAACATLPEAISRPRYALDRLLAEPAEPTGAVAPAPTAKGAVE